MSANEGVTKAIASFYQGDSDTVFLDLSYYYTCQLFLSQMREIFTLSWPKFPETSLRLSEDFRTLPKMSADIPKAFEHFWSYLKDNSFRVLWFRKNTKKTQSHHLTPFRIEFSLFIMCERTICRDLSVRREKLFFQGEIDVFSPQLSRIMHESWQEYNNLKV